MFSNNKRFLRLLLAVLILPFVVGCATTRLMPRSDDVTIGGVDWKSYADAHALYDSVNVGTTKIDELVGNDGKPLDIATQKNVRTLSRPSLSALFLENGSGNFDSLPDGVKVCLRYNIECSSYLIHQDSSKEVGVGSIALRFLRFKEESIIKGWYVDMLLLVVDGVIVYKHIEGTPNGTERYKSNTNPLGPFGTIPGLKK